MSEIYNELMRNYSRIRRENKNTELFRAEKLYAELPGLRQVEEELAQTGISVIRATLHSSEDAEALVYALREKNAELLAKKAQLLSDAGYGSDYLDPIYNCPICHDTGMDGDKRCICYKRALIKKHTEISGLSPLCLEDSFDKFELRYYSDIPDKKSGVSPRDEMKVVYNRCLGFAESFKSACGESLFMHGHTGLGKTFLCNCIANKLLSEGRTVMYFTAPQLFRLVESRRFNRGEDSSGTEAYDLIYSCELLIIDDLGTEMSTIVTDTELFNILNARLINAKPVIISTNLSHSEFIDSYSERIASRIFGNYLILEFSGSDIRMMKKYM